MSKPNHDYLGRRDASCGCCCVIDIAGLEHLIDDLEAARAELAREIARADNNGYRALTLEQDRDEARNAAQAWQGAHDEAETRAEVAEKERDEARAEVERLTTERDDWRAQATDEYPDGSD